MRTLTLAVAVLAAAGCKDKPAQQPVAKAEPPAKAANDAVAPAVNAEPPKLADHEQCQYRGGPITSGSLRAAAARMKVPEAKLDQVTKDLEAAFSASCEQQQWPFFVLQCIGTSPPQAESYDRCMQRLPDAKRAPWDAQLAAVVGKAGGEAPAPAPATGGTGTSFEELCPVFVAEVAHLDGCTGGNQYLPQLESVFFQARHAAVGGLIPVEEQGRIKQLCDAQAEVARREAAKDCAAQ